MDSFVTSKGKKENEEEAKCRGLDGDRATAPGVFAVLHAAAWNFLVPAKLCFESMWVDQAHDRPRMTAPRG